MLEKEDAECDDEPSNERCEKCANAPMCIKRVDFVLDQDLDVKIVPISKDIALRTVRRIRQESGDDEKVIRATLRTVAMCLIELEREYAKFRFRQSLNRKMAEN